LATLSKEKAVFAKTESILVNASPEAVYDYVSDFSRHPEWAHNKLEISVAGDGRGFEYVTHFMGDAAGKGEVTQAERPRVFAYECEDKDGRYRWTFDLEPEDSATRLTHSVQRLKAPLYIRLVQPLLWNRIGKKQVLGGLTNIKTRLESG
jgi:uncharacterized protein YndB with AHSA1/START domain